MTTAPALPSALMIPSDFEWPTEELGLYGEILPPLMLADYTTDAAVDEVLKVNGKLGGSTMKRTRGAALQDQITTGKTYVHQRRLGDVLAGDCQDVVEQAVYESITLKGMPVSVRPPTAEIVRFLTFAPVLQNLTPGVPTAGGKQTWQLGLAEHGLVKIIIEESPRQVIEKAWAVYLEWCEAEDAEFEKVVKKPLAALPLSLYHDFMLFMLEKAGEYDFGGGCRLRLLGKHETFLLEWPRGPRIIQTPRLRAVRLADALAHEEQPERTWSSTGLLLEWLGEIKAITADKVSWAGTPLGLPMQMEADGQKFIITQRDDTLALFSVLPSGGFNAKLAETHIVPPVADWLTRADPAGREVLVQWALWKWKAGIKKAKKEAV